MTQKQPKEFAYESFRCPKCGQRKKLFFLNDNKKIVDDIEKATYYKCFNCQDAGLIKKQKKQLMLNVK